MSSRENIKGPRNLNAIGPYSIDDCKFALSFERNFTASDGSIEIQFGKIFSQFAVSGKSLPDNFEFQNFLRHPAKRTWFLQDGRVRFFEDKRLSVFHLERYRQDQNIDAIFLRQAEVSIINYVTSRLKARIWIHGASLKKNNKIIFLVAPSGSGKTTLSLGLLQRGYKLITDDVIIINPDQGHVLPYPRCPKIRGRAVEQLRKLGDKVEDEMEMIEEFVILPSTYFEMTPQNLLQKNVNVFFLQPKDVITNSNPTRINYSVALIDMLRFSNILYQDNQLCACSKLFGSASFYKLKIDALSKNIQQIEDTCYADFSARI